MGPELASLIVAVITGLVGWWLRRGQTHTAQATAEGTERLAGKLDLVIATQQAEQRARYFIEARLSRIERHVGLSPYSPPSGTTAQKDA